MNSIGFEWMLFGDAILCFLYAPLMYFLRSPPTKEERKVRICNYGYNFNLLTNYLNYFSPLLQTLIGEKSSVRYINYQNEGDDNE